jgi:hypothetical protein
VPAKLKSRPALQGTLFAIDGARHACIKFTGTAAFDRLLDLRQ